MKKQLVALSSRLVVLLLTPLIVSTAFALPQDNKAKFVEDELLIQFVAGVPADKAQQVLRGHGLKEVQEIDSIRVKRVKVAPQALEQVKAALQKNPHVKFVENNFIADAGGIPNDPSYPNQWHLGKIAAPSAWDITTGMSTVDIAIVDSGVDSNHPDLAAKILPGWNFLNGTNDTHDVLGHGTAVAGTAAAIGNNAAGVAGLAWENGIMPLVVLDASDYATYSNIANAITYATDHGVRIINVSIGGTSSSSTLQNAVNYAWNKGALVFACAMNNGVSTPNYPAACTNAIAVASTDSSDNRSSFSNYGTWITVSAPGSYIYTTNNGGGYGAWNGTSFSTPLTAGLGALVLSVNPSLSAQQVRDLILMNADDLGTAGFDQYFGNGRINAARTLDATRNFVPPSDILAPSVTISLPANGATVKGLASIAVTATDNAAVTKVEFFINGILWASDVVEPFTFAWDTTTASDGSYQLQAKAYDAAGNSSVSSAVSVIVQNAVDLTPPVVQIVAPADGASIAGLKRVDISVSSYDDIGVAKTELYVDGALKATSTSSVFWSWNIRNAANGTHQIVAKSFDAAGNQTTKSISVVK